MYCNNLFPHITMFQPNIMVFKWCIRYLRCFDEYHMQNNLKQLSNSVACFFLVMFTKDINCHIVGLFMDILSICQLSGVFGLCYVVWNMRLIMGFHVFVSSFRGLNDSVIQWCLTHSFLMFLLVIYLSLDMHYI